MDPLGLHVPQVKNSFFWGPISTYDQPTEQERNSEVLWEVFLGLAWQWHTSRLLTLCCRELSHTAPPICKKDKGTQSSCVPRDEVHGLWGLACSHYHVNLI